MLGPDVDLRPATGLPSSSRTTRTSIACTGTSDIVFGLLRPSSPAAISSVWRANRGSATSSVIAARAPSSLSRKRPSWSVVAGPGQTVVSPCVP